MLQLKQITKVLTQGLTPVPIATTSETSPLISPLAISLLSHNGVALSTVYTNDHVNIDNIKVYLLLAYNHVRNIQDGSDWGLLEIDNTTNIAIEKLVIGTIPQLDLVTDNDGEPYIEYYVVILYGKELPNSIAKVKLDNLVEVLTKGLQGIVN